MKTIDVDEALYRYIASHTRHIGESASQILRRMLNFTEGTPAAPAIELPQKRKSEKNKVKVGDQQILAAKALQAKNTQEQVIRTLVASDYYCTQTWTVNRFLLLLSALYSANPENFTQSISTLHGRKRLYFSQVESTLLENGQHTKPKLIPNTPYWVITNTNHSRKRSMLEHIMINMQFSNELIKDVCDVL
jgi:negative modulator of initiation of replication